MYIKTPLLLFIVFLIIVLGACNDNGKETNEEAIGNPTPEEILSDDKNADIFFMDGTVYVKDMDVDEEFTIDEKVGEIKKQTDDSEEFEDFTASKLPTGTEIYEPEEKKGPIYIIKLDGKEIPYMGLVEG